MPQEVNIESVYATAKHVDPNWIMVLAAVSPTELPPIEVATDELGRHFTIDGHHRLGAAIFRGDSTIRVEETNRGPEVKEYYLRRFAQ